MKKFMLFMAVALIVILSGVAYGVDEEVTSRAAAFMTSDPKQWMMAYHDILEERKTTIKTLIDAINQKDVDSHYGSPMHQAIILLGMLRAEEAVGILTKNLIYLPLTRTGGYRIDGGDETPGYHVCARALVTIGEPSIDSMLYKIRLAKSVEERQVAAWVIMKIDGSDQALHRLDTLIKDGPQIQKYTDRYREARDFIANYKPDYRHPLQVKRDKEEAAKKAAESKKDEAPTAPPTQ
jgi:hypothetical protein